MSTTTAPPAAPARVELADVQGLVARGYASLRHASYVLLHFGDPAGARRWLAAVAPRVTPADRRTEDVAKDGEALNVAFTNPGFEALGLGPDVLRTFTLEFQQGMATDHRQRVLGDRDEAAPEKWLWGGPKTDPVHAILFLFSPTVHALDAAFEREKAAAAPHGVTVIERLGSIMLPEEKEHFGFHDGIAQPRVQGFVPDTQSAPTSEATIPSGEVVLGYTNAYGQIPDSPWVPRTADPRGVLPDYPADPDREDQSPRADLGKNGSYVVFRQLQQDVQGFWRFLDERARSNGGADPAARKRLGAKIVGRWPNGAPLVHFPDGEPAGYDAKTQDGDKFLYTDDLQGDRCPLGSHIRRSNPRDGMQPNPEGSLLVADRHRLLRRGRAYGAPLAASFDPDDILKADPARAREDRGLHFICFNTDIVRQFEFVQNTWTNSMKFDGLYSDPDPLVGPHCDPATVKRPELVSSFTQQQCPVRHRQNGVPRFVLMRGGAYLFMPGLKALRYLAEQG